MSGGLTISELMKEAKLKLSYFEKMSVLFLEKIPSLILSSFHSIILLAD